MKKQYTKARMPERCRFCGKLRVLVNGSICSQCFKREQKDSRKEPTPRIIVENPEEIKKKILGQKLLEFEVLTKEKHRKDSLNEEPFCADQEILMEFTNGKEIRIYIDREGNLCVYSD